MTPDETLSELGAMLADQIMDFFKLLDAAGHASAVVDTANGREDPSTPMQPLHDAQNAAASRLIEFCRLDAGKAVHMVLSTRKSS